MLIPQAIVEQAGGGLFSGYALLRDEKAANTGGGSFTSGAWRTRDLTIESFDVGGIVSLSSNQFTLQAGTYWIYARAPAAIAGDRHKAKIANITDVSDTLIGSSAFSSSGNDESDAIVQGRFTIGSAKTFELQHRCASNCSFGIESNFGVVEVYAEVQIWKES